MRRKVIKQAGQAYTITLPIEWVREHGIDKKSEVDVDTVEKSLIITSPTRVRGESIHVDVEGFTEKNLYLHLASLYARGVDEITLSSSKNISSEIMRSLANFIGFALVDQKKGEYVLRDMNGGAIPQIDDIFKRVFQMILLFYDAAIVDIFGKQKEDLESLKARDVEVNKFCLYLQRAINKRSYSSAINGRVLFTYSYMLEKISDEIERFWRTNIKYKVTKTKTLHELMQVSRETLARAFDFYYQKSPQMVDEIYKLRDKTREVSMNLLKLDLATARVVRHCVKISEDAADLSHLALMQDIDK